MMPDQIDTWTSTRLALHAVAEHVLSPALHAATGKIGLRQTEGGFGTPEFPAGNGPIRLRVDGTDIVVSDPRGDRREPIRTLRRCAALAGVSPGADTGVYQPTTSLDVDANLTVDDGAARRLAELYQLTNQALERLRDRASEEDPAIVQLWPEHFDIATTIGAVNFGGSPGDDDHPLPYLYVGPHDPPEVDGEFWNEPFGASIPADGIDVDAAMDFFVEGRDRLNR